MQNKVNQRLRGADAPLRQADSEQAKAALIDQLSQQISEDFNAHPHERELNISCSPDANMTKILAAALKQNTTITHIEIQAYDMGDEGLIALGHALQTNRTLVDCIIHAIDEPHEIFAHSNAITAFFNAIRNNTTLQMLSIGPLVGEENGFDCLANLSLNDTNIRELDLSGNLLDNRGAKNVAKMLAKNTTIHNINLSGCGIDVEGLRQLEAAIKHNDSLKSINLTHNMFNHLCVNPETKTLLSNINKQLERNNQGYQARMAIVHLLIREHIDENSNDGLFSHLDTPTAFQIMHHILTPYFNSPNTRDAIDDIYSREQRNLVMKRHNQALDRLEHFNPHNQAQHGRHNTRDAIDETYYWEQRNLAMERHHQALDRLGLFNPHNQAQHGRHALLPNEEAPKQEPETKRPRQK